MRQQALEKAIAVSAEEWVRRRDQHLELEYRVGRRLLGQAGRLAQLPIVLTDAEDGGKVVRIEPVEPGALRAASIIARGGSSLARQAIEAGLAPAKVEDAVRDPDSAHRSMDRAAREPEVWRAEQRRKILEAANGAPGAGGNAGIAAQSTPS